MADLGQAQVGLLRSTPKLTRINGDDNLKVNWKNMGNNHTYPLLWGSNHVVASGITTTTLASGVKFHGMDLATYGNVQITPNWSCGDWYITKDTTANTVTFTCVTAGADAGTSSVDARYMLGASDPVITGLFCSTWNASNIRSNFP